MTILFMDIENADDRLLLFGWAVDDGPVQVDREVNSYLKSLLADSSVIKVAHSTWDWRWLLLHGYAVGGPLHDTMVMAWTMDENTPLDLGWLVKAHLGFTLDKPLRRKRGRVHYEGRYLDDYDSWPLSLRARFRNYNAADVETLRELYKELRRKLDFSGWTPYWLRESVPYTTTVVGMESRGMPIDLRESGILASRLELELAVSRRWLLDEAGLPESFNFDSPTQLVAYLFSKQFTLKDRVPIGTGLSTAAVVAGLSQPRGFVVEKRGRKWLHGVWSLQGRELKPTPRTKDPRTGKEGRLPSTSAAELLYKHGQDPWIRELCLNYKKLSKVLSTYVRKFPKLAVDGRVFGRFNQTGTVTGRLSSSEPNMQNMPARGPLGKSVRGLFKGDFIIGDYDQLEMRLMAHFSQDPRLLDVFRQSLDPHVLTAEAVFGHATPEERDIGKTLNYAIGYGAGARKVARTLSLNGYPTNESTAAEYIGELEGYYDVLYEWKEATVDGALKAGFVKTIGGRRRRLSGQFADVSDWKKASYGARQAVNAVIQGSAADILQRVMIQMDWDYCRLICQVHDELIWEHDLMNVEEETVLDNIRVIAETGHGFQLDVPLVFQPKLASSWLEKAGHIETTDDEVAE